MMEKKDGIWLQVGSLIADGLPEELSIFFVKPYAVSEQHARLIASRMCLLRF